MKQFGIGQPVRRVEDRRFLVNAIVDAVGELGIDHLDIPLTPERLWRALRDAAPARAA